jgi:hypothetical protein
MRRAIVLLVVLTWTVADPSVCVPSALSIWDVYIEGGTGVIHATIGNRLYPPHLTTFTFGTAKEGMVGCGLGWMVEAVNGDGSRAPQECQPTNLAADGLTWPE